MKGETNMVKGKVDPGTVGMAAWFSWLGGVQARAGEKGTEALNWVKQGAGLVAYVLFNCDLVERS